MSYPVFISYARTTSRRYAEALHRELGDLAFLDTSDIEAGEQFPEVLVDALLSAKIVVVFLDDRYLERWYCRRELQTALKPFDALLRKGGQHEKALQQAINVFVLALPLNQSSKLNERLLHHVPPRLRTTNWPLANQTQEITQLILKRLPLLTYTIGEQLGRLNERILVRNELIQESALLPPADLRRIPHYLPAMPISLRKGFVGRANEIWKLHTMLDVIEGESSPTVALFQQGGFGKTQVAAEYVQRMGPMAFPGGLFWISAERVDEALESDFHQILKTLRPETPDLKTLRDSGRQVDTEMVNAIKNLPSQQRVLFVVDNVPEKPPKALTTWCPAKETSAVLATSRRKLSLFEPGIQEIIIHPLSIHSGVDLLTQNIERSRLSEAGWQRIAEWVGCLPLALVPLNKALQAGGLAAEELARKSESVSTTAELDTQVKDLREEIPPGTVRGVTEAFQISYDQLSPETQRASRLLAHLAPEPIPQKLLDSFDRNFFPNKVKNALRARAMVLPVTGSTTPMFGLMHRVLADFLRTQSGKHEDEIQGLTQALLTVMNPDACRDPKQWTLMTACTPHVEKLLRYLQDLAPEQHGTAVVQLGLGIGMLNSAQGLYGRAREQEEQTVFYAKTTLGAEHPNTLASMNNLASTLSHQGDYARAVSVQQKVLALRQRILGAEHPNTLASMNNLASTLSRQGDYARAVSLQQKVLALTQRILGEEHPSTSISAWNYLNSLLNTGDAKTASAVQDQYLVWLLERDPSTLGGYQQQIRAGIAKLLESTKGV